MAGVDISNEFLGMTMEPAIMNASGIFSYLPVLSRVQDRFGALVTKSIGYSEREGFENPVFGQMKDDVFINAVGLANPGYRAMMEELIEHYPMRRPLIVSLFGSRINEVKEIVTELQHACDAFELNLSCPHPKPGERTGAALGSDPLAVEAFVDSVKRASSKPVIAKLSYSLDDLDGTVNACLAGRVDALSATNTIGPADSWNPTTKWPILGNLKGGLSGPGIKEHGLFAVRRIRKLAPKIPIIGMGGIKTGKDIVEYIRSGADVVAIGSAFDMMDTKKVAAYMDWLASDLKKEISELGYKSLRNLPGRRH